MGTGTLLLADASLAIAGASAGVSFAQQQANADSQNQAARANATMAAQSYRHQVAQSQLQELQARETQSNEMQKQAVSGAQARGRVAASAAEAGVAGLSVDELVSEFDRQETNYRAAATYNFGIYQRQQHEGLLGAQAQAKGRVASSLLSSGPSPFVPLLATAVAGLDAYGKYVYPATPGRLGGGGGGGPSAMAGDYVRTPNRNYGGDRFA
jgi:hypothetical protein